MGLMVLEGGADRRAKPRYKAGGLTALVRTPDSTFEHIFEVTDISEAGLALVSATPRSFLLREQQVVEIELFEASGSIYCRGVVVRHFETEPFRTGIGVRVYDVRPGDLPRFLDLIRTQQVA